MLCCAVLCCAVRAVLQTLDLLFRMTNPVNVEFITEKLMTNLRIASDEFLRAELVDRITQCAER